MLGHKGAARILAGIASLVVASGNAYEVHVASTAPTIEAKADALGYSREINETKVLKAQYEKKDGDRFQRAVKICMAPPHFEPPTEESVDRCVRQEMRVDSSFNVTAKQFADTKETGLTRSAWVLSVVGAMLLAFGAYANVSTRRKAPAAPVL